MPTWQANEDWRLFREIVLLLAGEEALEVFAPFRPKGTVVPALAWSVLKEPFPRGAIDAVDRPVFTPGEEKRAMRDNPQQPNPKQWAPGSALGWPCRR